MTQYNLTIQLKNAEQIECLCYKDNEVLKNLMDEILIGKNSERKKEKRPTTLYKRNAG